MSKAPKLGEPLKTGSAELDASLARIRQKSPEFAAKFEQWLVKPKLRALAKAQSQGPKKRTKSKRPTPKPLATFGQVEFETPPSAHPTCDGGLLTISGRIRVGFQLKFDPKDRTGDLPTDVIAADLELADSTGQKWSTTARFTTELFLRHMVDISSTNGQLQRISSLESDERKALQNRVMLKSARFSSDDRFYRTLLIDDQSFEVPFHCTTISFDTALLQSSKSLSLTRLLVKVKRGSLFTDGEDVGEFAFRLELAHLWRSNTAVYNPDYECWQDSFLPSPLKFVRLESRDTPQDSVVYTKA